jgi:hypothetical protein
LPDLISLSGAKLDIAIRVARDYVTQVEAVLKPKNA